MALHRARDVAQDDEPARPIDGPAPQPGREVAAGGEVPPEHWRGAMRRPWGWSSCRRVRRSSRRGVSRSTSRSASRSSALVIRSKSRWRITSLAEYASGDTVTPSISRAVIGIGRDLCPERRRFGTAAPPTPAPRRPRPARPPRAERRAARARWGPSAGSAAGGASSDRTRGRRPRGRRAAGRRRPRRASRTVGRWPRSMIPSARAKSISDARSIWSPDRRSARPNPTASASSRRPSTASPVGARRIAGSPGSPGSGVDGCVIARIVPRQAPDRADRPARRA